MTNDDDESLAESLKQLRDDQSRCRSEVTFSLSKIINRSEAFNDFLRNEYREKREISWAG
jgi:hypothetical protein